MHSHVQQRTLYDCGESRDLCGYLGVACGVVSAGREAKTTAGARLERTLTRVLWIRHGEQRLQKWHVQVLNFYILDISTKARLDASIY